MPAKPKSAFPNPAATMPGEADVLANVLTDLSDHDAKLVYADWLEERDDKRGLLLREFITAYRTGKKPPSVKAALRSWGNLLGFSIVEKLHNTVLVSETDVILALARPAFAYKTVKAAEKSLAIGASKFGGRPDLPPGTNWPRHDEHPLSFLGQFNLADLQGSPVARELPATGVLSAFCLYLDDGNDDFPDGSWRLFYFPDVTKLVRREFDEELADESRFPSCRVEYAEVLTLPKASAPAAKVLRIADAHPADDVYGNLYWSLCTGDHILGYPFPIQGGSLGEKKGERHLLTICGNDQTGWEFADGGELYFVIDEEQLREGKFDRVNMMFDCA
jgi:uncharacterized protein (TIGR02996 family)